MRPRARKRLPKSLRNRLRKSPTPAPPAAMGAGLWKTDWGRGDVGVGKWDG